MKKGALVILESTVNPGTSEEIVRPIFERAGHTVGKDVFIAHCPERIDPGKSSFSAGYHIGNIARVVGAFTKAFTFSEILQDGRLRFNILPKLGESVSSVLIDKSISSRFLYILDDVFEYEVFEKGEKKENVRFVVKMDEYSAFYLQDEAKNRLYFFNDSKEFCFYDYKGGESHLKWLFILAPRTPFIATKGVKYVDFLPVYLLKSKFRQILIELASTINKDIYKLESEYIFDSQKIVSTYGEVKLDTTHKGHTNIRYNDIELKLTKG